MWLWRKYCSHWHHMPHLQWKEHSEEFLKHLLILMGMQIVQYQWAHIALHVPKHYFVSWESFDQQVIYYASLEHKKLSQNLNLTISLAATYLKYLSTIYHTTTFSSLLFHTQPVVMMKMALQKSTSKKKTSQVMQPSTNEGWPVTKKTWSPKERTLGSLSVRASKDISKGMPQKFRPDKNTKNSGIIVDFN